jgi:hypothetical protein
MFLDVQGVDNIFTDLCIASMGQKLGGGEFGLITIAVAVSHPESPLFPPNPNNFSVELH